MSSTQRICILLLLGCAFITGNASQFAGAQGEKPRGVPQWEITRVVRTNDGWLKSQELGSAGWELITVDASFYYLQRPK